MGLYTKIKGDINYTEIGSPTVLDGVASGFSTSNYLKLPTFSPGNKSWEMVYKFTTGSSVSSQYGIVTNLGTGDSVAPLYIGSSSSLNFFLSSNGTSWNITNSKPILTVQANTTYKIKLEFTGSAYNAYSFENNQWVLKNTVISSIPIYGGISLVFGNNRASGYSFNGSIDLNETYIKINNTVWFGTSFSKVKINTGLVRYAVVGSPSIINGIASNFSSSNYLTIPGKIYFGNTIEISGKITTGSDLTSDERCIFQGTTSAGSNIYFYYHNVRKGLVLYTGSSGTYIAGSTEFSVNTTYYFKVIYTSTEVKVYIGTDKNNLTQEMSSSNIPTSSDVYIQSLVIGRYTSPAHPWNGSFDLNEWSIKINNGYFWRGSHQNINAWKIQQDNFSKYYTIVDGKLMWANPDIYLKSSTTAQNLNHYINTNYYPNNNTRVITSFENSTRNYGIRLFGEQHSPNMFRFGTTNGTGWLFAYGSQGTSSSTINFIHERVKVDFNKNVIKINDTVINTFTEQTFTSTQPFYLMNINQSTMRDAWDAPVYWCKIYDNDILVRHFVPVPKGLLIGNFVVPSNGMFDIVEQKFYGNAGTGEFTIGGIPQDYIIEGGKLIWCNSDIYLQSSGTQWIDTNTIVNENTALNCKVVTTASGNQSFFGLFDTNNKIYGIGQQADQSLLFAQYYDTNGNSRIKSVAGNDNIIREFEFRKNKFYINNVLIGSMTAKTFSSINTVKLYTLQPTGTIGKVKGYNFKIYNDTIIQRYFIPVPKGMLIGDKIAPSNCMFDMVTQTFFENQGTGDFIIGGLSGDYINIGDNIVWTNDKIYLQSSGTQYIDTGFKANQDTFINLEYTPQTISGNRGVYCSRDTSEINSFTLFSIGSTYRYDYNTSQNSISGTISSGIKKVITADKNKFYVDGTLKYTATYSDFQSYYPILLFCSYVATSSSSGAANFNLMKLYFAQVKNNNKLVRYFLPVNTNTVIGSFTVPEPGMWDAVTKRFYPNKGTGTFTYGKDS